MELRCSTPSLSTKIREIINERNIFTTREKSKVFRALDEELSHIQEIKQEKLRSKAVEEIFTTEETYLRQLEIAMTYFKNPVEESNFQLPKSLKSVFQNLESVYNVNGELLSQLRMYGDNVGPAFCRVGPFLKLYSAYAYEFKHGLDDLQEILSKPNNKLGIFIKSQETRPEVSMKLSSLLITPIQRVPRYRLLLKELLNRTSPNHEHYPSLIEALKEVETATEHINNLVNAQENMDRIIELQRCFIGAKPTLIHPGRLLLKEGSLMKISNASKKAFPRYFILMSDVLIYCKHTGLTNGEINALRCCCVLPLNKCTIEHSVNDKIFTVTCDNISLVLYSRDPADGWIKSIQQAIKQEQEGRSTLKLRKSVRYPLKNKSNNCLDKMTPTKRKLEQEQLLDQPIILHSPLKRIRINSKSDTKDLVPANQTKGFFATLRQIISNM